MASINRIAQWSDSYSLGLPEIDDQHHALIDLMNDLWAAIAANAPNQSCEAILRRLENYTVAHFGEEETMMRAIGYPDFAAHKHAHDHFVERLQEELERHGNGEKLSLNMLHFLQDWLVKHILGDDKAYATYFVGKTRPVGFLKRFFQQFNFA